MSNNDTAATIEDGMNESLQAGNTTKSNSGLRQHVINELRRKAPQAAAQKKKPFDVDRWLQQISDQAKAFETKQKLLERVRAMGPDKLDEPFEAVRQHDRENGHFGPYGIYSVLVLNTFLDTVEHLTTAAQNNPELYRRSEFKAFDLLREIAASPDQVLDFAERHNLELVD